VPYAFLDELLTGGYVAERRVPRYEICLGIQNKAPWRRGVYVVQQHTGEAVAPGVGTGHHPADAVATVGFDQDAQVGRRTGCSV